MNKIVLIALLFVSIIACKQKSKKTRDPQFQNKNIAEQPAKMTSTIYGNYVDESYDKRAEGYDWVAVSVKPNGDSSISVYVRSRADKKKPTCTFDTEAFRKDENSYEAVYDGKKIIFDFTAYDISISTENKEESYILHSFCNGGASITGTYKKIDEKSDAK